MLLFKVLHHLSIIRILDCVPMFLCIDQILFTCNLLKTLFSKLWISVFFFCTIFHLKSYSPYLDTSSFSNLKSVSPSLKFLADSAHSSIQLPAAFWLIPEPSMQVSFSHMGIITLNLQTMFSVIFLKTNKVEWMNLRISKSVHI